jgi:hypothetical protein
MDYNQLGDSVVASSWPNTKRTDESKSNLLELSLPRIIIVKAKAVAFRESRNKTTQRAFEPYPYSTTSTVLENRMRGTVPLHIVTLVATVAATRTTVLLQQNISSVDGHEYQESSQYALRSLLQPNTLLRICYSIAATA